MFQQHSVVFPLPLKLTEESKWVDMAIHLLMASAMAKNQHRILVQPAWARDVDTELAAKITDRAAELGRSLTEEEIEELAPGLNADLSSLGPPEEDPNAREIVVIVDWPGSGSDYPPETWVATQHREDDGSVTLRDWTREMESNSWILELLSVLA
jgi:hypothetical protein